MDNPKVLQPTQLEIKCNKMLSISLQYSPSVITYTCMYSMYLNRTFDGQIKFI